MEKIKLFIFGNREPAYTNKLPNQLSLGCRAIVGAYLLYLAKGLVDDFSTVKTSNMQIIITIAIVLFSVCGFLFLYDALRNYVIGRYPGGKLDLGENPDNALDCKDEDDYDDVVTEDEALEEYAADEAQDHSETEE
ncbi:MAG: hypothetical protein Q4D29_08030 [Lachnospiraceae bacterium]|nr:hypothetical protein [Lachnospiraceae bacterium]